MHIYAWTLVGVMLVAIYVVPISIGLFVAKLRTAIMLATASFCGLFASVWSALQPLLAPLASVISQFELLAVVILTLLAGMLQAALLATLGFWLRRLLRVAQDQCPTVLPPTDINHRRLMQL
jgi:hypothetical protein